MPLTCFPIFQLIKFNMFTTEHTTIEWTININITIVINSLWQIHLNGKMISFE